MEEKEFIAGIVNAVQHRSAGELSGCVSEYAHFCFKDDAQSGGFSAAVFDMIVMLMEDERYLSMDGASELLMILRYDWGLLSHHQRGRLIREIETSYEHFRDWMAHFMLAELLGENYCNEESLQVLLRLSRSKRELARQMIPYGLQRLVVLSQDEVLRKSAYSLIQSMCGDHSEAVQNEAKQAIAAVQARRRTP